MTRVGNRTVLLIVLLRACRAGALACRSLGLHYKLTAEGGCPTRRAGLLLRIVAAGVLGFAWTGFAAADDDGLHRLVRAYPQQFSAIDKPNVLRWKDGTETAYDDGVVKASLDDMLKQASPRDQMSLPYPCGWPMQEPAKDGEPGRVRCEALFSKMYGNSAAEVGRSLVDVAWPAAGASKRVKFTRINDAAHALEQVAKEINALPDEVKRYVAKPVGTFSWRPIAGEERRSPHSYGIAIDFQLPAPVYRYWRWDAKGAPDAPTYPPMVLGDPRLGQIVTVFERHGFIWGGKWRHYDTMHFEYRPELTEAK